MTIDELNKSDSDLAQEVLTRCCGATRWVAAMLLARPFDSDEDVYTASEKAFELLEPNDWIEAFSHHPKIGDIDSLRSRFASTAEWAVGEQAGAANAEEGILHALAAGNVTYEKRFGYIFIVCATGKSAAEMLAILSARLPNEPDAELRIAAGEQRKITRIRLEKLLA